MSKFWFSLIIWDISFADIVRWDKNLYPFGEIGSSSGLSNINLAIVSLSSSASNVRFDKSVFALFSGRSA